VKCTSRILAVYNNELVLGGACIGSEYHCKTKKSFENLTKPCLRSESILLISRLRRSETTHQQRVGRYESVGYWRMASASAFFRSFSASEMTYIVLGGALNSTHSLAGGGHFEHTLFYEDDVMWHVWRFWETELRDCQSCLSLFSSSFHLHLVGILCWRLNIILQISQAIASTYFRLSGHFRHNLVKSFFWNKPSNCYWKRFIFDSHGAKEKFAQVFFLRHDVYIYAVVALLRHIMYWNFVKLLLHMFHLALCVCVCVCGLRNSDGSDWQLCCEQRRLWSAVHSRPSWSDLLLSLGICSHGWYHLVSRYSHFHLVLSMYW